MVSKQTLKSCYFLPYVALLFIIKSPSSILNILQFTYTILSGVHEKVIETNTYRRKLKMIEICFDFVLSNTESGIVRKRGKRDISDKK